MLIQDVEQKILKLNKLGYNIVEIEDHFYAFNSFNQAENNITQHDLIGRDITNLLNTQSLHMNVDNQNTDNALMTAIEDLILIKKSFHKNYLYIVYLAL